MKLDSTELQTRAKSYARDNYVFIYAVMKGASVANAALTVGVILAVQKTIFSPRIAFWIVSFAAVLLTHVTTFRGILFAGHRVNAFDSVLPFLLAIVEFLLFLILLPPISLFQPDGTPDTLWNNWYLILGLHALTASAIVMNRAAQVEKQDFDDELHPLVDHYRKWMRRDIRGSFICGCFWIVMWAVMIFYVLPNYEHWQQLQWLLAIPALLVILMVIRTAENDRRFINNFLLGERISTIENENQEEELNILTIDD